MKRKNDDGMVQTAVRLPQSLRERLSKAGGERGLGEEIRGRLEASFEAAKAPTDPKTPELLDAIAYCAEEIARDLRPWSADAFAFAVLKETINKLLSHFEPKGEAVPHLNPDSALVFLFDDEPSPKPEKVSRYFVGFWTKRKAERAAEEKRR
jgi:hypothetical protein